MTSPIPPRVVHWQTTGPLTVEPVGLLRDRVALARPVVGPVAAKSLGGAGDRRVIESLKLAVLYLTQHVTDDRYLACRVAHRDKVPTVECNDLPECLQERPSARVRSGAVQRVDEQLAAQPAGQ